MERKPYIQDFLFAKEQRKLAKESMHIAWPVLMEVLLGTLFSMVDLMMIGKISKVAAESVAAVGMTMQPLLMGLNLVQALNIGGTAMIARYYGAKRYDQMADVLRHVMVLAMIFFAIPITVGAIYFTDPIFQLLGAEPQVIEIGRWYFRIVMIGFLFQALSLTITAALRGVGETKVPMKHNVIANCFNVVGNAVLIYGFLGIPPLGLIGAGIATAVANVIAMGLNLRYILRDQSVLSFDWRAKFRFRATTMFNLVKVGLPSACEQLVFRLGMLTFLRMISSLGTLVYASHQIVVNILALSFAPGQAFGITAAAFVGRELGAKQPKKAEQYAVLIGRMGAWYSLGMGLLFYFGGYWIAQLFTNDQMILTNVTTVLKIVGLVQPFLSHQLILSEALRGAGDTVWPLVSTFVGILIVRVSLGYWFIIHWQLGLIGAWLTIFIDQVLRWIIIYVRFKKGNWKKIQLR